MVLRIFRPPREPTKLHADLAALHIAVAVSTRIASDKGKALMQIKANSACIAGLCLQNDGTAAFQPRLLPRNRHQRAAKSLPSIRYVHPKLCHAQPIRPCLRTSFDGGDKAIFFSHTPRAGTIPPWLIQLIRKIIFLRRMRNGRNCLSFPEKKRKTVRCAPRLYLIIFVCRIADGKHGSLPFFLWQVKDSLCI